MSERIILEQQAPVRIVPVAHDDPRAVALRSHLDDDLAERYRDSHADEPSEHRAARLRALQVHPEQVVATLIAVDEDDTAVGHVILRRLGEEWEVKRMIVTPAARGRGVARALMARAIDRARRGGARRVILQTGALQPESIRLYESLGFARIPVYEPYVETMPTSLCFELIL